VAPSGRLAPPFAGASFARFSRSFVTPRYGVVAAIQDGATIGRYAAKWGGATHH